MFQISYSIIDVRTTKSTPIVPINSTNKLIKIRYSLNVPTNLSLHHFRYSFIIHDNQVINILLDINSTNKLIKLRYFLNVPTNLSLHHFRHVFIIHDNQVINILLDVLLLNMPRNFEMLAI